MIKRLGHVCLGTRSLEKILDFYINLLGCKLIHEFKNAQGELYGAFLLVNNGTFIEFFNDQTTPSKQGLFRHLCFEVEDIHHFAEKVRSVGFDVDVNRGKTDNTLQFWIKDPDGNEIEFHEYDSESKITPFSS